jgi:hypothetical protein
LCHPAQSGCLYYSSRTNPKRNPRSIGLLTMGPPFHRKHPPPAHLTAAGNVWTDCNGKAVNLVEVDYICIDASNQAVGKLDLCAPLPPSHKPTDPPPPRQRQKNSPKPVTSDQSQVPRLPSPPPLLSTQPPDQNPTRPPLLLSSYTAAAQEVMYLRLGQICGGYGAPAALAAAWMAGAEV